MSVVSPIRLLARGTPAAGHNLKNVVLVHLRLASSIRQKPQLPSDQTNVTCGSSPPLGPDRVLPATSFTSCSPDGAVKIRRNDHPSAGRTLAQLREQSDSPTLLQTGPQCQCGRCCRGQSAGPRTGPPWLSRETEGGSTLL